LTMNVPRFPAPFFVVTVITLEPLPSMRSSDTPRTRLFPLPAIEALMVRVPVAFTIVNTADPLFFVESLWLKFSSIGLIADVHCAAGDGDGEALGVGVAVGVGVGFPFPLPLLPSLPLPLPCGVGVGDGAGVGVGVASGSPSPEIGGVADGSGVGVAVGVGVGVEVESTSPVTSAISTGGIS